MDHQTGMEKFVAQPKQNPDFGGCCFFAVLLSTIAESLKQGVFENLVKNVVSFYTGYIQVHKMGYQQEQILDNSFEDKSTIKDAIKSSMNIRVLAPRLEGFALASSEALTKGCLIIGVDPALENDITGLKARLVTGTYLNNRDTGVMIAEGLAKRLNISLQDTVVLIGQGYHGATAAGKYPVKGLLRFGSPQLNDKLLYMPLPVAQEFFSAQQFITSYVLSLHSDNDLNQTAKQVSKQIGDQYEVMTWEELLPDIKQHIQTDSNNMKVVQGVLYLLIFFGIFSTQINPAAIIMISLITSLPAPVK